MTFEIKVDADAVLKQFDELTKNIAELSQTELTTTFTAWQHDDMHRKFPKVDGSGASVSTEIFPRSQLPRKKNLRTGGNSVRRRSRVAAGRAQASGLPKPILRPELYEKLKDRMLEMLKEAATWQ